MSILGLNLVSCHELEGPASFYHSSIVATRYDFWWNWLVREGVEESYT